MCYGSANNKNNNSIINNIENYDIEDDSGNYNDIETKFKSKFYSNSNANIGTTSSTNIEPEITCRVMSNIKKNSSDPKDIYTTRRQDYYSSSSRESLNNYPSYPYKYEREYINYEKQNKKKCVIFWKSIK